MRHFIPRSMKVGEHEISVVYSPLLVAFLPCLNRPVMARAADLNEACSSFSSASAPGSLSPSRPRDSIYW